MEKTEDSILRLFLYNYKLKFNEVERLLKQRSNKIAYHIKNLVKRGILEKKEGYYFLNDNSEYLIPYLSDKSSVLPVILICIGDSKKAFLFKREKRPFKNLLSLPGGRLLLGESIEKATSRIMKEKFNLDVKFKKINLILLEHVIKNNKILHSFLLIAINAKTKDKLELTDIKDNKKKIISSDYNILNSRTGKININTIKTKI